MTVLVMNVGQIADGRGWDRLTLQSSMKAAKECHSKREEKGELKVRQYFTVPWVSSSWAEAGLAVCGWI